MTSPVPPDHEDPDELVRRVGDTPLFRSVDRARLAGLREHCRWVTLAAGEVLFHERDTVDALYLVLDGRLQVTRAREPVGDVASDDSAPLVLAEIGPPAMIGEMQILTGGTRSATVTALIPSRLVQLPKPAFDALLAQDREIVQELTKTIMPRLYRDQLVAVLPKLFGELDDPMLRDLESKMTWVHLPRGHVLCFQGEPSDSFYIVISGRLEVLIKDAGGDLRQVGEVAQGEAVGEIGVFTGQPRSATIIASRDSELVQFSREEFEEFSTRYPALMRHLARLLIQRLRRVDRGERTSRLSSNILLAAANDGVPIIEFATRVDATLRDSFGQPGSRTQACLLLTSYEVDRRFGVPGIAQSAEGAPDDLRLRSWLSQQEQQYRVILFLADPTVTEWTKRCIRSADEIMFVAEANRPPRITQVAHEIQRQEVHHQTRRRRALVLLQEDQTPRPVQTMRWLEELRLVTPPSERQPRTRHFHLRRSQDRDYQRVARYVSRQEVGLVLSGGGARGFAHVGCLQAMRELNIPIDMIGGVSMGSLIAAAYAIDPGSFDERIRMIKSRLKGVLFDITVPVVSIARGRRFDQRLQSWFGDARIEDLWIPYFCVSSNLTEADIVVLDRDALWWAVRASGTLPGLTAPMIRDGCLLFDGCLLDNLPMDVMRERLDTSQVIAVDVVPPHDLKVSVTEVQSPSGWWLLWKKLTGLGPKVELPGIISIMQRAAELGSVYGRQRMIDEHLADLYLRPPVEEIAIAQFAKVDEAARIGYEHCKQRLADWWSDRAQRIHPMS